MGKFACLPSLLACESICSAAAAVAIRSHIFQVPSVDGAVALWNPVGLQALNWDLELMPPAHGLSS